MIPYNSLPVKLPARLEPFGGIGWTMFGFADVGSRDAWMIANPQARMPCWKRIEAKRLLP
jgi:hypothetical protein